MSNILHNATVDTLLERRSIRKFKPKPLSNDIVETLETVAQHAASSQFLNDWPAIRITDPATKKRLAEIGGQPYISTAPLLDEAVENARQSDLIVLVVFLPFRCCSRRGAPFYKNLLVSFRLPGKQLAVGESRH